MKEWENRCYSSGIPDEITHLLLASNRVPSYKAIAICLLKNDLQLKGLGFSGKTSKWHEFYKLEKAEKESPQIKLL